MAVSERRWFLDQASRKEKIIEITAILSFIEGMDVEVRRLGERLMIFFPFHRRGTRQAAGEGVLLLPVVDDLRSYVLVVVL